MEGKEILVSASPHIFTKNNTQSIMRDVIIALIPAFLGSIYFFGVNSFIITSVAIISAVLTEAIIQKLSGKSLAINDLSAVVTGMLLAFTLPSSVPIWIPVIGSVFAVAIVKHCFGGLGNNFMNPAIAGRLFLVFSFGKEMGGWIRPITLDAMSSGTPLAIIKNMSRFSTSNNTLIDLAIGRVAGSLGETSAILLLVGGLYLLYRKVISVRIPLAYIVSFSIMIILFGTSKTIDYLMFHLLAGGLFLGAFFMATDYASSPISSRGKIIFGVGCGVLTALIRIYGGYPEGVGLAIILMNVATPLIDKYTRPRVYGGVKK